MPPDPISPPNPSDMRTLAALAPNSANLRDPTLHAMVPLLSVLSKKWVRDFLFTSSPIHISHLLSPAVATTSLTCLMGATGSDPTPSPHATTLHGESYHMAAHALYTPAFTADGVTLGVGAVQGCIAVEPWLSNSAPGQRWCANHRFVRDTAARTLLTVFDAPADDCCILQYMLLESATRTHNLTGFFRRRKLLDIIQREDGPISLHHLLSCVTRYQNAIHDRPCAVCGAAPTLNCSCEPIVSAPRHPHDNIHFMAGMYQHASVSEGVTTKVLKAAQGRDKRIALGSRIFVIGIADINITQRLRSWSIREYVKGVREDPLQSRLMLGFDEDDGDVGDVTTQQQLAVADDVFSKLFSSSAGTQQAENDLGSNFLLAKRGAGTEASLGLGLAAETEWGYESMSKNQVVEDAWWEEKADMKLPHELQQVAILQPEPDVPIIDLFDSVASIAKAAGAATGQEEAVDPVAAERERRAAVRREKNRAAARRSNLKRREIRDQVRNELSKERAKIPRLLKRELCLRRDNLDLRKKLAEERGRRSDVKEATDGN